MLPVEMLTAMRWLLWRLIHNTDPTKKPRKKPFYCNGIARNGRLDSPGDIAQLSSFDVAQKTLNAGGYTGIGFALGPDCAGNYWQGIDLDDVVGHPGLIDLIAMLPGYVERSPSGFGFHAIGYGRPFRSLGANGTGIEAYASGRFFTITGRTL